MATKARHDIMSSDGADKFDPLIMDVFTERGIKKMAIE
jgi:hypothetical protein